MSFSIGFFACDRCTRFPTTVPQRTSARQLHLYLAGCAWLLGFLEILILSIRSPARDATRAHGVIDGTLHGWCEDGWSVAESSGACGRAALVDFDGLYVGVSLCCRQSLSLPHLCFFDLAYVR